MKRILFGVFFVFAAVVLSRCGTDSATTTVTSSLPTQVAADITLTE